MKTRRGTRGGDTDDAEFSGAFSLKAQPPRCSLEQLHLLVLPLLLLVFADATAWSVSLMQHRSEVERARELIRAQLEPVRGKLSRELYGAVQLTQGLAGIIAMEGGISEEKFRTLAQELLQLSSIIRNIALAPNNVITQVFPFEGNEKAVGFDFATSSEQWASVQKMMVERRMVVAGPVELVQGGIGVIGRTPIYVPNPERPGGRARTGGSPRR